jgi:hypothetical protein
MYEEGRFHWACNPKIGKWSLTYLYTRRVLELSNSSAWGLFEPIS